MREGKQNIHRAVDHVVVMEERAAENRQLYDLTRRDIYDGNDIFDIERTLKEHLKRWEQKTNYRPQWKEN